MVGLALLCPSALYYINMTNLTILIYWRWAEPIEQIVQ